MKITLRDILNAAFTLILVPLVILLWDLNKNVNTLNIHMNVQNTTNEGYKEKFAAYDKKFEKIEDKLELKLYDRKDN